MKVLPKDLGISFNFEILDYKDRILKIKINGWIKRIEYSKKVYEWFMEDLDLFLNKSGFKRRWDYSVIIISNIESLKYSSKDTEKFIKDFKKVNVWEMRFE